MKNPKCTKILGGRGFVLDPTGDAHSAPAVPSWWEGGKPPLQVPGGPASSLLASSFGP